MHSLSMSAMGASVVRPTRSLLLLLFAALLFLGMPEALAHAVAEGDKGFICGFHADSDTHSTHIRTVIPR